VYLLMELTATGCHLPSQSVTCHRTPILDLHTPGRGASLAIWDHTMLPATHTSEHTLS